MENKNTNNNNNTNSQVRQTIKWNKFRNRWERANVVRKESNTCATRADGRTFEVRWNGNENYSDIN